MREGEGEMGIGDDPIYEWLAAAGNEEEIDG